MVIMVIVYLLVVRVLQLQESWVEEAIRRILKPLRKNLLLLKRVKKRPKMKNSNLKE